MEKQVSVGMDSKEWEVLNLSFFPASAGCPSPQPPHPRTAQCPWPQPPAPADHSRPESKPRTTYYSRVDYSQRIKVVDYQSLRRVWLTVTSIHSYTFSIIPRALRE